MCLGNVLLSTGALLLAGLLPLAAGSAFVQALSIFAKHERFRYSLPSLDGRRMPEDVPTATWYASCIYYIAFQQYVARALTMGCACSCHQPPGERSSAGTQANTRVHANVKPIEELPCSVGQTAPCQMDVAVPENLLGHEQATTSHRPSQPLIDGHRGWNVWCLLGCT
jgi:hypothetical protein